MKHRICHILQSSGHGGIGIAHTVATLHRHADPDRYEIVACLVGEAEPSKGFFEKHGMKTKVIAWHHPSRDIFGLLHLLRYVIHEDFDILHFHWGGPVLRTLCHWFSQGRIILHIHSSVVEATMADYVSTTASDAVIVVSHSLAASVRHAMVRVIWPGVEVGEPISRANDDSTIGYAGRLSAVKGISHLLAALALVRKEFSDVRLRIAGDGPEREQLTSETRSLVPGQCVTFLGWIDEISAERRAWTVAVQPSLHEGMPFSVLEAMAQGIPVVASAVGGLPELLTDSTGVLVPAGDAAALAGAIQKLLRDAELRRRMGKAAAERVQQQFTAHTMAKRTLEFYEEVLSAK